MITPKILISRLAARLNALFGRGLVATIALLVLAGLALSAAALWYVGSAAPSTLIIVSGPKGSVFDHTAQRYQQILAREGVTVRIVPTGGSVDNLRLLKDAHQKADVGFVLGGEAGAVADGRLVSLGSISYQPLLIFYRGEPRSLLSDFKGGRLDIGRPGTGTRELALTLLKLNGIVPGDGTQMIESLPGDAVDALRHERIDAIFVMGDSASTDMMRELLHTPGIRLFNVTQADAYTRRVSYLNKLELPMGVLDVGKNIPPETTELIGPSVELVARAGLHPALSDLLLDAAREVHGKAGVLRKQGEFPSAVEHEIPLSEDARRYYTSGKSLLYRTFPFWLAGLIARALAVIVPLGLFLIPALKMAPAIYRWRIQSSIHRWYRALLDLEQEAHRRADDIERLRELAHHLDHIERTVSKISVPAAFGEYLYGLRGHIKFVRERLLERIAAAEDVA
ncbi:MAG: hypothetical protein JO171_07255 [Paludibacterium sp.]|uniref:TAXI family TRAP transporter solute-binding subunit n=1 Tax=Paludibacterium sp. TaxID=1917523 RepID=UPI0025F32B5D|nr:TAXI family TRAP transporter solute-binding subunit [Paludibacterium sp.]MBV8046932.1 hypothetical protein [Paludibacterium sp.]MBV8646525.1 hypothetical protein [Paludibacterium sp.]